MAKVLVVDDETSIVELIKFNLEKDCHQVITATNGEEALRLVRLESPDLMVLDMMIPGIDGLEVCRCLRSEQTGAYLPIIMLSARAETTDQVIGLEMGADDYMAKPFSPRELSARVKANLRRQKRAIPPRKKIIAGDLELDTEKYKVYLKGNLINLTPKEFELLHILMSNPGKVYSREMLFERVWHLRDGIDTHTVDVHICYIRRKIEQDPVSPKYIITVRGFGYKFVD